MKIIEFAKAKRSNENKNNFASFFMCKKSEGFVKDKHFDQ